MLLPNTCNPLLPTLILLLRHHLLYCSTEGVHLTYLFFLSEEGFPSESPSMSSVGLCSSERGNAVFKVSTIYRAICSHSYIPLRIYCIWTVKQKRFIWLYIPAFWIWDPMYYMKRQCIMSEGIFIHMGLTV